MSDPAASGIFQNVVKLHPFPPASRYFQIETTKWQTAEGKTIVYIRRRFLPPADRFEQILEHSVVQGDRLDNVTAHYLGDPEQFWRVCDANNVMQPDELTATVGSKISITLPEGIQERPMLKGLYLTLLVGPVVPVPMPQVVMDALTQVTVQSATTGASGFELSFTLSNRSPLHTVFLLAAGDMPLLRVMLVVTINGTPQVLMDGVTTQVEVQPGAGGQSTLAVKGHDLTKLMDSNLIDLSGLPYPAMPAEARVALIIAKYAMFGLIPMVIPSLFIDVPLPIDRLPAQHGSDLHYVRELAEDVGYVFYIDPGPLPGMNTAYWGPEIKIGPPQLALNFDMDAHTNVESLSFNFKTAENVLPIVFIQNALTKAPIPIPIPNINPLQPPLGVTGLIPTRVEVLRDTAKLSPMAAIGRGVAAGSKSADSVTGTGSLDVLRYGRLLKARQLVGVRGAGMAFDGLYFVESVTSTIKRGELKQSFNLTRNGLISITPKVPV